MLPCGDLTQGLLFVVAALTDRRAAIGQEWIHSERIDFSARSSKVNGLKTDLIALIL